MKKWIVALLICSPAYVWAASETSEDDLLNFDAIDTGEDTSKPKKPEPKPQDAPPPPAAQAPPEEKKPVGKQEKAEEKKVEKPKILPPKEEPAPESQVAPLEPPPPEAPPVEEPPAPKKSRQSEEVADAAPAGSDEKFEARLARIYEKYNQATISNDEWSKIAGNRLTESYSLQQGDTLWDISTKFFGNGFYWPKVWQLNDKITNPHNVSTGDALKFSPGSTTEPPKLEVEPSPEQKLTQNVDTGEVGAFPAEIDGPIIPPPKDSKPVLRKLPPSFLDSSRTYEQYDESGFSTEVIQTKVPKSNIGYVSSLSEDDPWESSGKIVETEAGSDRAATFQKIYVKLDKPAQPGEKIIAFSNMGGIQDVAGGGTQGYEVRVKGEIEIIKVIEADLYQAMVTKTLFPLEVGDRLKIGEGLKTVPLSAKGEIASARAKIINGEFGARRVFGLHQIVFLDKGSSDGVQEGAILPVVKNAKTRKSDSNLTYHPDSIAKLRIAHVGKQVSTAIVVEETDAVMPGDLTYFAGTAPTSQSENEAEEAAKSDSGSSEPTEE